jgi:hypothetical protein
MSRTRLAAGACALALLLAGCGGGDGDNGKPAIKTAQHVKVEKSLLGSGDSAGTLEDSYVPEGEIVSDSGFRPETDGFLFENYGNDVEPVNLGPAQIEDLFGAQVCLSGSGDDCALIPAAQRWMENQNERMDGGHCMGFSVAALRLYGETLDPEPFGGGPTASFPIVDNVLLQADIAENWVYQDLQAVKESVVEGTPSEVLQALADALDSGDETYTLAIFMPDFSGGHAITPFAIEDKGDGRYAMLVYDNNFPGITRAVEVDTNEDTWSYVGGTNPKDLDEVYKGDAETKTMSLYPTSPGEGTQPCPFCDGEAAGEGSEAVGSVLPKADRYSEITLGGDVANHPHLVFTDDKGRQTGIVDGTLKREIPGVEVVQTFSTRNWESSPEPKFRVPEGKDFNITIDATDLKRKTTAKVDLVGNGLVIAVEEIKLEPGQRDELTIPSGYGLIYETHGSDNASPELYAGVATDKAAFTFSAASLGVKKGSSIGLLVDQESGTVLLDSTGSRGSIERKGFYALAIAKATDTGGVEAWSTGDLRLDGTKGEVAIFNYDDTPAKGTALDLLVGPEDGPFKTVKAAYDD